MIQLGKSKPLPSTVLKFKMTYYPLPTIDALRQHLEIPEINTGREYTVLGPNGIVTDDLEALHAILSEEYGKVRLWSGTEFFHTVYRGQTEEYSTCSPLLGRKMHIEEQLLDLCCNVAFEDAIGEHPFVRRCERTEFEGVPLFVDKQGLAQHYGLTTDRLDMTCNFDVACFFATCVWDGRKYRPVESTTTPGILYRAMPFMFEAGSFCAVGWQPFHRPEQQRAYAIKMKNGQDFGKIPGVQKVKFCQHPEISNRIWKSFDEGRALFPPDAAAHLAEQAKLLTQFTRSQLDRAWSMLDAWHGFASAVDNRLAVEQRLGVQVENALLSWAGLDVDHDEHRLRSRLEDVLSKVRFRRAMYV